MVYQVENTLKENADKFEGEDRANAEQVLADLRKALEQGDTAEIQGATERLEKASHKLAEVMYRSQDETAGAGPGAEASGGGPGPGVDEVIDAEVVEDGKS